ncbi:hypothetical protein BC826DRAFT_1018929 [Russula brevipes]|nr:hypothetical protein BC826DRAFT_1018929 [Russula brevipes]
MSLPTQNGLLLLLPNELVIKILATLDHRGLTSCMQVCKRILDLVRSSCLLQYHLELARSYMEDGHLSRMSISERRERLKAHIKAWTDAQWSSYIHLLDMDRNTFVMDVAVGGILTFISRKEGKMKFVQLPSNSRGIAMRQWEHSLPFIPAKYALDPSEDILIVLEHEEWRIHYLSLRSGDPHPLAADFCLSDPPLAHRRPAHLQLIVARNYVAALIPRYQLTICDWKTGQTVLCIPSSIVRSVAFLPENHVLLASTHARDLAPRVVPDGSVDGPVLAVYDLDQVASMRVRSSPAPAAIFALELGYVIPIDMRLHYRLNSPSYSPEVAVPFFGSPAEQLVALQTSSRVYSTCGVRIGPLLHQILLIPITRLLCHLRPTRNRQTRHIQWNDWGATGTRRAPDPQFSHLARNALSGSRFIPRFESRNSICIWDFSRPRVAPFQILASEYAPRVQREIGLPTGIIGRAIEVSESAPCVQREVTLPIDIVGKVTAAISEDVIVISESHTSGERVYLLVF